MAVYIKKSVPRWTEEDIDLLRLGQVPEGRTEQAAMAKARSMGIRAFERTGKNTRWTTDEFDMLERGEKPEGRSEKACIYKGMSLGLDVKFDEEGRMSVVRKKPGNRRGQLLNRAIRFAKMRDGGATLAEIGRRDGVSRQRVNEIIGQLSSIR
jgi:hypothetical protein